MSQNSAQQGEKVFPTSFDDEIIVEKRIEKVEDDTPDIVAKISFSMRSHTESPEFIRLVDTLPLDWPEDHVGFHPDHEPDQWSFEDGVVIYEHELAPNGEHETLYAVRMEDESDIELFYHPVDVKVGGRSAGLEEEAHEHWNNGDSATERSSREDEGVTEGVESRTAGASNKILPTEDVQPESGEHLKAVQDDEQSAVAKTSVDSPLSGTEETDAVAWTNTADLTAPPLTRGSSADPSTSSAPAGSLETGASPTRAPAEGPAQLIGRLIAGLRDHATEEQIASLSNALDIHGDTSLEARVEYLQQEQSEISAYKDALRQFLDSKGSAPEVIESIQADQARMESELEEQAAQLDEMRYREREIEELHSRLSDFEGRYDTLSERIDTIAVDLETIESRQSEKIETLTDKVDQLDDRLRDTLGEIGGFDDISDELEDDVDRVRDEIQEMREILQQTQHWQQELRAAFERIGDEFAPENDS